jgi:hypothetical protein
MTCRLFEKPRAAAVAAPMLTISLAFCAALTVSDTALAQGVYETVPLKSKEPDVLIKTSRELQAYFRQHSAI